MNMNSYTSLVSFLIFILLTGISAAKKFDIIGSSKYLRANNNSPEGISNEIMRIEFMNRIGVPAIIIDDIKIKFKDLNKDDFLWENKPEINSTKLAFRCFISTKDQNLSPRDLLKIETYIKIRLNGLSQFGCYYLLKCMFGENNGGRQVIYDGFPTNRFERFMDPPSWINSFFNEGFSASDRHLWLFKDGDLAWVLESIDGDMDRCNFIFGLDGKHFNTTGFEKVFLSVREEIPSKRITNIQADRISQQLKINWSLNWYSPFDIPNPLDYE
jgi:hypothetical protein